MSAVRFLLSRLFLSVAALMFSQAALADEAAIRKNLPERLPQLPAIDEVTKTPIAGIYEVRFNGNQVIYSDENGTYVFEGSLIETRTRTDLTDARVKKLSAIDFAQLPLKDAIVWKAGNGSRRMAVFADPNCGYCKQFEANLQKVKNVTVYTFLLPVLGGDSPQKSENIWCAKDQAKAWLGWMLENKNPVKNMGVCETPMTRNLAFARKYRITGTPAIFFVDGTRVPGAMTTEQIEQQLTASAKPAAPAGN